MPHCCPPHFSMPLITQRDEPFIEPKIYRFRVGEAENSPSHSPGCTAITGQTLHAALAVLGVDTATTCAKVTFHKVKRNDVLYVWPVSQVGDLTTCYEVCAGSIWEQKKHDHNSLWSKSASTIKEERHWVAPDRQTNYTGSPLDSNLDRQFMTEAFFSDGLLKRARTAKKGDWEPEGEDRALSKGPVIRWLSHCKDRGITLAELSTAVPAHELDARELIIDTIFAIAKEIHSEDGENSKESSNSKMKQKSQ